MSVYDPLQGEKETDDAQRRDIPQKAETDIRFMLFVVIGIISYVTAGVIAVVLAIYAPLSCQECPDLCQWVCMP